MITPQCDVVGCTVEASTYVVVVSKRRIQSTRNACSQHSETVLQQFAGSPRQVTNLTSAQSREEFVFDVEALVSRNFSTENWFILREVHGTLWFPVTTGPMELSALHASLSGAGTRPHTHASMLNAIKLLGGTVKDVIIDRLLGTGPTFGAHIRIVRSGEVLLLDVRPSDAIVLAIEANAPILVGHELIVEAQRGKFFLGQR